MIRVERAPFAALAGVLSVLVGCGDDSGGDDGNAGVTGLSGPAGAGATGGVAAPAGSGGMMSTSGTGGMVAGTGGMQAAGTGGLPAGGAGGMNAGMGGNGGASGGCSAADEANACNGRNCGMDPVCGVLCGTCPGEQVCLNGLCGEDPLASDPMNCGAAGRVCRSQEAGACVDGRCVPSLSECVVRDQGEMATCDELCGSFGESCHAAGCAGYLSLGYAGADLCQARSSGGDHLASECDSPNTWSILHSAISCCCTDTQ